jgi:hypothetical protein
MAINRPPKLTQRAGEPGHLPPDDSYDVRRALPAALVDGLDRDALLRIALRRGMGLHYAGLGDHWRLVQRGEVVS